MAAGKIVFGIIERRIKALCVRAAGPAQAALKDAAAVNMKTEVVLCDRAAGATWTRGRALACRCRRARR